MADDIVIQLRTTLASSEDVYKTMFDAADEVERLRAKLALTEEEMVRMARMMREMTESHRQLRQEYEKVRNNA